MNMEQRDLNTLKLKIGVTQLRAKEYQQLLETGRDRKGPPPVPLEEVQHA
jgi:hypothetical protein